MVLCSAPNCLAPSSAGYICIARDHSFWALVSFRTAAVGARQSILPRARESFKASDRMVRAQRKDSPFGERKSPRRSRLWDEKQEKKRCV